MQRRAHALFRDLEAQQQGVEQLVGREEGPGRRIHGEHRNLPRKRRENGSTKFNTKFATKSLVVDSEAD